MGFQLRSRSFEHGQAIPVRHTGDGEDVSPELSWTAPPAGTKELALVVDDPDAPTPQPWVHWVLYRIPAEVGGVAEGLPRSATLADPRGALQGRNSWGATGYRGPAPPRGHGVHHYQFTLYALDATVDAGPGLEKEELLRKIRPNVLAEARLTGTYHR